MQFDHKRAFQEYHFDSVFLFIGKHTKWQSICYSRCFYVFSIGKSQSSIPKSKRNVVLSPALASSVLIFFLCSHVFIFCFYKKQFDTRENVYSSQERGWPQSNAATSYFVTTFLFFWSSYLPTNRFILDCCLFEMFSRSLIDANMLRNSSRNCLFTRVRKCVNVSVETRDAREP